jgi:predicted nuclease of predicted toxin-antitoxin system
MIIVDVQLSPAIAAWIQQQFGTEAVALRDLGLRDAEDRAVFDYARERGAVVMTKDSDFVSLLQRRGAPPQVHLADVRQHVERSAALDSGEGPAGCTETAGARRTTG